MSLLGLTGSILVWRAPLERAIYPHLFVAATGARLASPSQFMEAVRVAQPAAKINRIHLPEEPGDTVEVRFKLEDENFLAYLDPQSAQLRGIVSADGTLTGWIFELHRTLLLKNGSWINTIGAIGGCVVMLSGLWLWWPSLQRWRSDLKQRLTVKRGTSRRRLMHDLHNVFGIYSLPLLLLLFSTGAVMQELYEPFKNVVYRLTNTPQDVEPVTIAPSNRTPKNVDALFQAADTALPGTKTTHVFPPKKPGEAFRTIVKDPHGIKHFGYAQILVDPNTGRVVQLLDDRQPTGGKKIMALVTPLHLGEFGGIAARVLYTLAGLMPLLLFITGFWKWNNKRHGRAKNRARHTRKTEQPAGVGDDPVSVT